MGRQGDASDFEAGIVGRDRSEGGCTMTARLVLIAVVVVFLCSLHPRLLHGA